MKKELFTNRFALIAGIILLGALLRLVPHWPNFTPIASIALFGGALFKKKYWAFIITFSAMIISDLFIGLHTYIIPVYISFALVIGVGIILSKKINIFTVMTGALGAAVLFFLTTNFAVWASTSFYPHNFAGLVECYTLAIPFFHYSILGNLFYSSLFFGAFYLVKRRFPALAS